MTALDTAPLNVDVAYGLCDADQHYYEALDALTRHLDPKFRSAVKWVDIEGRKTLLINQKLVTVIPNPTYDPVGVPGSLEQYFRAANQAGREIRDIISMQSIQPEYRDRDERIKRLDAQGVDFAWLLPSLALGLEEILSDDPDVLYPIFTAHNDWLDEDWGFNRDGRLQTGPLISLVDPVRAEAETKRVLEMGARFLTFRPAPTQAITKYRSIADPLHDRVFAMIAEANAVVTIHAADSGYGLMLERWGEASKFAGFKSSPLTEVMSIHIERPIFDTMAAMICHGLFDRHPNLRVASLELGAAWVPELLRRLRVTYGKTPQLFAQDPVESFREHVWVAPFYEDNIASLVDAIGADRVLLGSDWPHPEGLSTPRHWIADFASLSEDDLRKVLRDNLRGLAGL
ncbi:MAG: amidohydrolase family protein [Acidimicrobiia bacterium]